MTDYTDLKARLRVRRMQDGEMPNHYVRRLEVDRMEALAAITALEADIARLQTAHVQMQRAHDDLAAENARLRGAIERADMALDWCPAARDIGGTLSAALTAPTSGC